MTSAHLRTRPATTLTMTMVFDDDATVRNALAFEAALATVQSELGLIPKVVADRITAACGTIIVDPVLLADQAALAGTLAIPLVAQLRAAITDNAAAATAVHFGATSQDLSDSVLMMQAKAAIKILITDLDRLSAALINAADAYSDILAIGRTLLQDAAPITLGLRIAQWLAGLSEARRRLEQEAATALTVQFGGASGTRAGLAGKGAEVARRLAGKLGLACPTAPWHARRGAIAGMAAAIGIMIGALAKIARDISLLSQNAIDEVREPDVTGRGGSSAMAHKRNPTGCQVALSAALRAPGLVAAIMSALPQEHERGLGGWQADGPILAELFQLAAGAAGAMADVTEGLQIDRAALARNLAAAGIGQDAGESQAIIAAIMKEYKAKP